MISCNITLTLTVSLVLWFFIISQTLCLAMQGRITRAMWPVACHKGVHFCTLWLAVRVNITLYYVGMTLDRMRIQRCALWWPRSICLCTESIRPMITEWRVWYKHYIHRFTMTMFIRGWQLFWVICNSWTCTPAISLCMNCLLASFDL